MRLSHFYLKKLENAFQKFILKVAIVATKSKEERSKLELKNDF